MIPFKAPYLKPFLFVFFVILLGNSSFAETVICRDVIRAAAEAQRGVYWIDLFRNRELTKRVGAGGIFEVFEIKDVPNLVVKRLRSRAQLHQQGKLTREQYFQMLREQHEMIDRYFGKAFVPRTIFLKLPYTLKVSEALLAEGVETTNDSNEYVMIQDRLYGEEYYAGLKQVASPALKANLLEFIKRVQLMQRDGIAIEDQVMIDRVKQRVQISDTNFPKRFLPSFFEHEVFRPFFKAYDMRASDIQSPRHLLQALLKNVDEFQDFRDKPFLEYAEMISARDNPTFYNRIEKRLAAEGKRDVYISIVQMSFVLESFPPEGNSRFVRRLIQDFDLTP